MISSVNANSTACSPCQAGSSQGTVENSSSAPYTPRINNDGRRYCQPSLKDRIIYPFKAGCNRFLETIGRGFLPGVGVCAIPGAIAGLVAGLWVSPFVAFGSLITGRKSELPGYSVAVNGALLGAGISLPVGIVVTGVAMAVCGVIRGAACLPLDIYRACSQDTLCLDSPTRPKPWYDITTEFTRLWQNCKSNKSA